MQIVTESGDTGIYIYINNYVVVVVLLVSDRDEDVFCTWTSGLKLQFCRHWPRFEIN